MYVYVMTHIIVFQRKFRWKLDKVYSSISLNNLDLTISYANEHLFSPKIYSSKNTRPGYGLQCPRFAVHPKGAANSVSVYEVHVYIIWVFCLCMRYMYISSGCFVCVSVYEIHVYIIWVFCLCICVWDTCIYHLGVLSVYEIHVYIIWVFCLCICVWDTCIYHMGVLSVYLSMRYMYISFGCFIWLPDVPASTVYLSIITAVMNEWSRGFFFGKTCIIISYFRFQLRLPLSRTAVTWTEYCWYSVKHKTINQSFVGEGLWSILLYTSKCYSKPILDPNTFFNMLNISLPVSKNTKAQWKFGQIE